jgi:hypothetical protein
MQCHRFAIGRARTSLDLDEGNQGKSLAIVDLVGGGVAITIAQCGEWLAP